MRIRKGRPVVVADPNHLRNRTLEFYADAVTDTPLKAANTLLDLLRAEATWGGSQTRITAGTIQTAQAGHLDSHCMQTREMR